MVQKKHVGTKSWTQTKNWTHNTKLWSKKFGWNQKTDPRTNGHGIQAIPQNKKKVSKQNSAWPNLV